MNTYLLSLLLTILALFSQGQEIYEGFVYDLGTRTAVSDVEVRSPIAGSTTLTDISGFFSIQLNSIQERSENADIYAVLNNRVFYD